MIRRIVRSAKAAYKRHAKQRVFQDIYRKNLWKDGESLSGGGSSLTASSKVRSQLPALLESYRIESLLDAPCGDFYWMRTLDMPRLVKQYYGVDIVPELIASNNSSFSSAGVEFLCKDVVKDELPRADLILCRHLLIHLCLEDGRAAIRNFQRSGAEYLLITNQNEVEENREILFTGSFRPVNLQRPPFSFPEPLATIDDSQSATDHAVLALYRLNDIRV